MSNRAPGPERLVHTIYCEAKCPDQEVFYFGSDDEQYDNPVQRKHRYELAGQRFLAGSTPRLFSASLKGPFGSDSGWKNPWASKTHLTRALLPEPQPSNVTKENKLTTTIDRPSYPRFDKPECHLPSPQSLKTTSVSSESHPFLGDEELQAVQSWRHSIQEAEPGSVQQPLPSVGSLLTRKRKSGQKWLKTVADKKLRMGSHEERDEAHFDSEPVSLEMSKSIGPRAQLVAKLFEPELTKVNRQLQPTARLPQRESASQLISPPKQSAVPINTPKSKHPVSTGRDPHLSKELQAAATLSSPISLQSIKQEAPSTQTSPLKFKVGRCSASDRSATKADTGSLEKQVVSGTTEKVKRSLQDKIQDDIDFIFNITVTPHSDSLESEEEELSSEALGTSTEASRHKPNTSINEMCRDIFQSSDSELSELSHSPEMSDLEMFAGESEAESEAESEEADAEANCDETKIAGGTAAVIEAIAPEAVETARANSAVDVPGATGPEEDSEANKAPILAEDAAVETASVLEAVEASTEPIEHGKGTELSTCPSVQSGTTHLLKADIEPDTELSATANAATEHRALSTMATETPEAHIDGHVSSAAIAKKAQRHCGNPPAPEASVQPPTTVELPEAPCPHIKQEAAEFSLKAIFKNFVPANTWAQLAQLTSGSEQSAPTPIAREQFVLPSMETTPAEEAVLHPMVVESDLDEGEPKPNANATGTVPQETKQSCQQLLAKQDRAVAPQAHQPPRLGTQGSTEDSTDISRSQPPPKFEVKNPAAAEGPPTMIMDFQTTHCPAMLLKAASQSDGATGQTTPRKQLPTGAAEAPPCDNSAANTPQATIHAIPVGATTPSPVKNSCTSEPQFTFKTFATFTTPSPERLRFKKRRTLPGSSLRHPRLTGILSSRVPGSARRTDNRVSWAVLPREDAAGTEWLASTAAARKEQPSPPPRTPLAELPTASNEKFSKHFSSVLKRTDGLRHRFHVAADRDEEAGPLRVSSQSAVNSSNRQSSNQVAKINGDTEMKDAPAREQDDIENWGGLREATMSVEPMDMVEDMVREMGDFWQAWDVDVELSAERKRAMTTGSQARNG